MIRVLFVCLGNICRSPMAEAIFRSKLAQEGLEEKIEVDSAGVGHWHIGSPPHKGTRDILEKNEVSTEGITARQIKEEDWEDFDYLIAMDNNNVRDIHSIREKDGVVVQKLMDYVPDAPKSEVPDPYFTGNFDETYSLVREGCERLLEAIKREHTL
ncbi:low molecular weight protein-tyrosine-phosphatase [Salimicrobium halophilum]|uniref:protein-tyrosine-phosphatase n=1 Tax=Salimicrobium halophilum TaxID=86666 RepID=A0A1G8U7X5_9BACI|nr:low molecular weight protein-tyrosine-phosphatase [Salimicrobium halophilum]SDJ49734.1 protein tyrosine phosphatase [Salimicrobium halophilum]